MTRDQRAKVLALRAAAPGLDADARWRLRYLLEMPEHTTLSDRQAEVLDSVSFGGRDQLVHTPLPADPDPGNVEERDLSERAWPGPRRRPFLR